MDHRFLLLKLKTLQTIYTDLSVWWLEMVTCLSLLLWIMMGYDDILLYEQQWNILYYFKWMLQHIYHNFLMKTLFKYWNNLLYKNEMILEFFLLSSFTKKWFEKWHHRIVLPLDSKFWIFWKGSYYFNFDGYT